MFDNSLFDVPTILLPNHLYHLMNISLASQHTPGLNKVIDCKVEVKIGACGNFPYIIPR